MKKIISLFLSLTMLLSLTAGLDFSAYADTLTTGKCGKNVTYSFDSDTGTLTISGTGDMYNYYFDDSVFYNNKNIKVVIIEKGVTNIGNYAFCSCTSLTSITIPGSVTSIGGSAFYYCTSLTSITIPDSVISIGNDAFWNCTSLASVTIPDSVTSIGRAAFSDCTRLTSINVEKNNINYSSVNGVLFDRNQNELICYPAGKNDKTYEIPNSVTSIGASAFRSCTSLTRVTIPNGVTSIGDYAFYYCTSLTRVTIPNGVTSIGDYAFYYCTSLTSITIPDSVTSIGGSAFSDCTSLTSVTIPDSVTSISNIAFMNCESLISINVEENNSNYSSVNGVLFDLNQNELICYPAGKNDKTYEIPDGVTSIGGYSFYRCESLTSITISDSVTSIGNYAFSDCTSLTSVTISDSVTSIGNYAFRSCTSLTSVTIPDSVTSIGDYAFGNCTSLTSVTIPDSVTSISNIAFSDCTSLTSINVEKNNKNYSSVNGVLFNRNQNKLICYPAGKNDKTYEIPNSVTSIGGYAFSSCTSLTSVTIPNGVTSISYSAFSACKSLTSITIPDSVTSIGDYAFCECESLTSVTIPNGVTSIDNHAFWNCTSLKNIILLSINCNFGYCFVGRNVKIYGFENSTADKYATSNGNDFVKIYCNDYGMEHVYKGKVIKQPTCTTKGVTRYTCSRCGDSYDKENVDILEHNYEAKVVTQPTCTEKGVTRYICFYCGDSYDEENIDALGHNYEANVVTQPTCTAKGVTRYTCTRCGDRYDKDDIAVLGHSYTEKITKNPTCEEEGTKQYICSRCGDSYTTSVQALGHDLKLTESVKPTILSDGYDLYECQRLGCDYFEETDYPQLTLDYNKKICSNGTDTYKIEMAKSGYLVFDFVGESESWSINIYDEDHKKVDALTPQYKEFYKKSYLQMGAGETVPNKNQIVTLFAGTYYVEIKRLNASTNDNFSGDYEFSIDYTPSAETIKETKSDFYYDAPTAKSINLNKTYNGFLGAKYAAVTYSGKDLITTDERDAYKFEIPKGSGWSQFSLTLTSKTFGPFDSYCAVTVYNSEFEPCAEFTPLLVNSNKTNNEIAYLYEGVYYIAVENRNPDPAYYKQAPIEYSFTTSFKPSGTFTCITHRSKLTETKNPTCTKDGYKLYTCQICNAQYKEIIKAKGHTIVTDKGVPATCTGSGLTSGTHCSTCGAIITSQRIIAKTGHTYKQSVTPAAIGKDGKIVKKCSVCGATVTSSIAKISTASLSAVNYTYNGGVKTPSVTVKDSKGKKLSKGKDYTVSYSSGRKNVGRYAVKIKLKGNYSGTVTKTFDIVPKGTSIKKISASKKGFKVYWKAQKKNTTGYEIQYSTAKSFKNAKTVKVSKNSATSQSVAKLSRKKKYFVRVRTYKTVKFNGKKCKVHSSWSTPKTVVTKK